MSPILSLEKATVLSQGRKPLGIGCVPHTKSPEGAAETSIDLSPLRGLAICGIPVQGLAPLAKKKGSYSLRRKAKRSELT